MIGVWLAHAAAHYVDLTGRSLRSRRGVVHGSSTGRRYASRRTMTPSTSRCSRTRDQRLAVRALCARGLDRSLAVGAHGLAADRHRRLERRHEPCRRSRAAARAYGSAGSCYATLARLRRPLPEARHETTRAARNGASHAADLAHRPRARGAGTAPGIAAAISTTARRSAQRRPSSECRIDSIAQSWAVLSQVLPIRNAHAAAAMEAVGRGMLVRRDDGQAGAAVHAALRFTRRSRSRLCQGAYPPGDPGEWRPVHPCRRVVGDRLGRGSARETRRPTLFALLNPINRSDDAQRR